jgi:hypothetical protein
VPRVIAAGAFPELERVRLKDVPPSSPTATVPKEAVEGEIVNVTPCGVTLSGIWIVRLAGSLVERVSVPVMAVAAAALAEMGLDFNTMDAEALAATLPELPLTMENPEPDTEAE